MESLSIHRYLPTVLLAFFTVIATVTVLHLTTAQANSNQFNSPYIQRVLRSWIGEHYSQLSRSWGVPTTWFYTQDGRKLYIFTANAIQVQTQRISCIRKVLVNYDDTIMEGYWEGNCDPATAHLGDTSSWPNWQRFGMEQQGNNADPYSTAITTTTNR